MVYCGNKQIRRRHSQEKLNEPGDFLLHAAEPRWCT